MLRVKTKLLGGKKTYYHFISKEQRRHKRLQTVRRSYSSVGFCILTLGFIGLFQNFSGGQEVMSPGRQVAVVSSEGKPGVSKPKGVVPQDKKKNPKKVLGSTVKKNVAPVTTTIPPKPAWVNLPLYTDPLNSAAQYLVANPTAKGAKYISRMSKTPVAQWFGDWNANVRNEVNSYVSAAAAQGRVPVVVVYNIPNRDCGGYSVGGANGIANYANWVSQVAAGIGNRTAVVVLEPDALGALDCLPVSVQNERTRSISKAVTILKANPGTAVYIDAGTPVWQPAEVMASRLTSANVGAAEGFSINVSYFASTSSNRIYGDQLSGLIGNKHYVIDTSRNGGNHYVTGMQCNPAWASFGDTPTTNTGSSVNDALLWIKIPWESDGQCNGSPNPGVSYWSYAIQLAKNAGW